MKQFHERLEHLVDELESFKRDLDAYEEPTIDERIEWRLLNIARGALEMFYESFPTVEPNE